LLANGGDTSGSDLSEPYNDDDVNSTGDDLDLEVNFESEADILAVEMSGDELERGMATSRDFSELSSQVTAEHLHTQSTPQNHLLATGCLFKYTVTRIYCI